MSQFPAQIPVTGESLPLVRSSSGFGGYSCNPSGNIEEVPFDLDSVPLEDWLKDTREAREIPWTVEIREPRLQLDQRIAVHYAGRVSLKKLKGDHKLAFVAGVTSSDGTELIEPDVHAVDITETVSRDADVVFSGCLYFRPGTYTVWLAVHDATTGKHSLTRRKIRVTNLKDDPLPMLDSRLPAVRFPEFPDEKAELSRVLPDRWFLPVANKRPLMVDVISLIPPAPPDVVALLAQMDLTDSSVSITALDVENQKVVYDGSAAGNFDFTSMLKAVETNFQDQTVHVTDLQNRKRDYFRNFLKERIKNPAGMFRVVILISGPFSLPRDVDTSPIKLEQNCECSIIHLRFSAGGVGDELEKILKFLNPRRFEIDSPLELRKAIARIVQQLESF